MHHEYIKIANEIAEKHNISYLELTSINGVMWYLQDEFYAAINEYLKDFGHCNAFTSKLEGEKPNLFKDRCLIAINLVKKNSLV